MPGVYGPPALQLKAAQTTNPTATVQLDGDASFSNTDFIWTPKTLFAAQTSYTVTVSSTVPGQSFSYSFQFTTGADSDTTAPRLVSITPDPASAVIDPADALRFQFSEPLSRWDWSPKLTDGAGLAIEGGGAVLLADRRTVEVRAIPRYRLPSNVQVQFDPTRFRDMAGNPYAENSLGARFTTFIARDYPAPKLVGQYPEAGETGVPTSVVPQLLFDQPVAVGDGGITVEAKGQKIPAFADVRGNVVSLGQVTLPNTTYTIRIVNVFATNTSMPVAPAEFQFTTAAGALPAGNSSSGVTPASGWTNVPRNARVVIHSTNPLPPFAPLLFDSRVRTSAVPSRRLIGEATLSTDRKTLVLIPSEPFPAWTEVTYDDVQLKDINGQQVSTSVTLRATDAFDLEPPLVLASSPAGDAIDMPTSTPVSIRLNETIGMMTPLTAFRLLKNGEAVEGVAAITGQAMEFRPAKALETGAEYVMEADGVADVAGNVMPKWTAIFRTAGSPVTPTQFTQVVHSSLDDGAPGAFDAIEVQFSNPLSPAKTSVSASINVPRQFDSPLQFEHPVTTDVSGTTVRITPVLPWPAGRDLALVLTTFDQWSRQANYNASFRARPSEDTTRPEVVSITPAPGTPIRSGDAVQVRFSEPMLTASVVKGLAVVQSIFNALLVTAWSDDRQTLTVTVRVANTDQGVPSAPIVVVVSDAMTDLAGNALRPVVARFPLAELRLPVVQPTIAARIPATVPLEATAPLNLVFSGPIDAEALNRAALLVSTEGRISGRWTTSGDGTTATFQPDRPWPAGAMVRLFLEEPIFGLSYEFAFSIAATPSKLTLLRTSTFSDTHPANAVLDFEFDREPAAGSTPIKLFVNNAAVAVQQSRPRARTVRLTPTSPLPVDAYLRIVGEGIPYFSTPSLDFSIRITAALPADSVEIVRQAPPDGASDVPRNARVSLLLNGALNLLTLHPDTVKLTSGGRTLSWRLADDIAPNGPIRIVPSDLLPAGATVEARLDGLEDRIGRRLAPVTWTFGAGTSVDLSKPTLVYSNLPLTTSVPGFDPTAPVRVVFDEAIDPASFANYSSRDNSATIELSPDLRSITVRPVTSWNRGLDIYSSLNLCDLSGNCGSGWSSTKAGFDAQGTPVIIRATSLRDGQTNVPINVQFAVLFDRQLGSEALRGMRLIRGGELIPWGPATLSVEGRLSFGPESPLDPNTSYEWVLDDVMDASGNRILEPRTIHFTTGEQYDTTPLSVTLRSLSRTSVRIKVSEPIDLTTVAMNAKPLSRKDTRLGAQTIPSEIGWSEDQMELTVTAKSDLAPGSEYTVNLAELRDLAGQRWGAAITFSPIENPEANPVVVTFQPPDGSTAVPTNAKVFVSYSRGTIPGNVRLYQNDQLVATATPSAGMVTATNFSWTLKPSTPYRIESDAFQDEYGVEAPAASASFTTGPGTDTTALTLNSTSPANNEAGVPPDTPWRFTFNKTLSRSVFLDFVFASREMPFRTTVATSREVLTVTPYPAWPAASTIQTTLYPLGRAGVPTVTDWAGNRLRSQTTLTFRTAAINDPTPPVLESATPPTGTPIPGGDSTIVLRFSKPLMGLAQGLQLYFGAERGSTFGGSWSSDYKTFTMLVTAPANSRLTIVGTADLRDNADNPATPFVLEYPTGERAPQGSPTYQLVEPKPAEKIPANSTFLMRFDRVMAAESVQQAFRITQNGENVAGVMTVVEDGRAYRFTPTGLLAAGATIRVFLLPTAMDLDGRKVSDYSSVDMRQFVVEGGTASFSIVQRGFTAEAPADAVLEVEFDRDVDRGSVHGETVWLRKGSRLVSGHATLRDDRILQFTPDEPLEVGAEYVLTAGAGLRSLDGAEFQGQDMRVRAVGPAPAAAVESVDAVRWEAHEAVRVRFTGAVSPLAGRNVVLERDGKAVAHRAIRSWDGREIVLAPEDDGAGEWSVSFDRVPGRNGRPLASERLKVVGTPEKRR